MAILLSDYLEVSKEELEKEGVFNSVIGLDTQLFLDPHLLKGTKLLEFKDSREKIKRYYEKIITLIVAHRKSGDMAWKEALRRLTFKEVQGVFMGYGVHGGDGNAIGRVLAKRLLCSAIEIVEMGIKEPEIFELIGFFEEGFGADRLSDMTISVIQKDIYKYTQNLVNQFGVNKIIEIKYEDEKFKMPRDPRKNGALILLPKVLLRDLPVALGWEGIDYVVSTNQELRDRINKLIGYTWKKISKRLLREYFLTDKKIIETLIEAYRNSKASHYDYVNDPKGVVFPYPVGTQYAALNPIDLAISNYTIANVKKVVSSIIQQFKKLIEFNGLNKLLYTQEGKPRPERSAQVLFYGVADRYCKENDLDISSEPDAGNGPVDFKFSKGYSSRILVEMKLSSNPRLIHGFQKQLPTYQKSESTPVSYYVVIRNRKSDKNIKNLLKYRDEQVKHNREIPEIIVIDGWIKPSASKR